MCTVCHFEADSSDSDWRGKSRREARQRLDSRCGIIGENFSFVEIDKITIKQKPDRFLISIGFVVSKIY